jgi:hypothetical protein
VIEAGGAPSDEAFARATAEMLTTIDNQRAVVEVQRLTNDHTPEDTFQMRGTTPITYAQRKAELDKSERHLRDSVPESVLKRADELLG